MTHPLPPVAGVIGWPVAHSKSPMIHRFWLCKLGLDGDYSRFPVHPDGLAATIRALPALGLRGVNVTVPHKQAVLAALDVIDPLAARVGAVNTVIVGDDGKLTGFNTDVAGVLEPLRNVPERPLPKQHVATHHHLVGAGGAARAVMVALWGADITVFNRNLDRARALSDEFGPGSDIGFAQSLDSLPQAPFVFDPQYPDMKLNRGEDQRYSYVFINASTLGMHGQPPVPVNLDCYPDDTIVFDMVYAPLETSLLAAARARGMRTIDGLQMLVAQAAAAFALFYGIEAPREHDAELRGLLTR